MHLGEVDGIGRVVGHDFVVWVGMGDSKQMVAVQDFVAKTTHHELRAS